MRMTKTKTQPTKADLQKECERLDQLVKDMRKVLSDIENRGGVAGEMARVARL